MNLCILYAYLCILLLQPAHSKLLRIAGVFDQEDDATRDLLKIAFASAVKDVNRERMVPQTSLDAQTEEILPGNSFKAGKRVCDIFRSGAAAVFGPSSDTSANHVSSLCNALKIPHIETSWRRKKDGALGHTNTINLYPHPAPLSKAFRDVILTLKWKRFAFLYQDNSGLVMLQELLKAAAESEYVHGETVKYSVRRLPPNGDYRPLLKSLHRRSITNLVVDCERDAVPEFLEQATEVSMMGDYHAYFFTTLDLATLDLSKYLVRDTNITGFRMINPNNEKLITTINNWKYMGLRSQNNLDITAETLTLETALLHDGVKLFAHALRDEYARGNVVHAKPLLCDSDQIWDVGSDIISTMKTLDLPEGFTGFVKLDREGLRTGFSLDFVMIKRNKIKVLGTWDNLTGYTPAQTGEEINKETEEEMASKTFIVTTVLSAPYTFNRSANSHSPDENFEGYAVDLIHEISKEKAFKFKFKLTEDGAYGKRNKKGEWNGMIRELLDGKADLALVDLTITYERLEAVDFTTPFMNLGISILYTKPSKQDPNLFSFLSPLSKEVWIFMATAYLGVSILLFMLARISPDEWGNPYPCIEDPDNLENDFTLLNSLWFTIGSLMQQGSDIAPKAISTRMVASIWWFFTLIIISSYTANLAAFLTVSRMDSPIKSAEDLAKQTKIKYGTLKSGSTYSFFEKSTDPVFKRMFTFMKETVPTVYVGGNSEGVAKVLREKGGYAYLMESTSIDYTIERNCQLQQIGGLLDSKGYGIALPPNSKYRSAISDAILKLQEKNVLHILKKRWWQDKGGGGKCKTDEKTSAELDMTNVGGVFVVLVGGMGGAIIVSFLEFIWKSRKLALEERASICTEMGREISFVVRCQGNTKPVSRKPPDGKPFLESKPEWGFEEYESNKSDTMP